MLVHRKRDRVRVIGGASRGEQYFFFQLYTVGAWRCTQTPFDYLAFLLQWVIHSVKSSMKVRCVSLHAALNKLVFFILHPLGCFSVPDSCIEMHMTQDI